MLQLTHTRCFRRGRSRTEFNSHNRCFRRGRYRNGSNSQRADSLSQVPIYTRRRPATTTMPPPSRVGAAKRNATRCLIPSANGRLIRSARCLRHNSSHSGGRTSKVNQQSSKRQSWMSRIIKQRARPAIRKANIFHFRRMETGPMTLAG